MPTLKNGNSGDKFAAKMAAGGPWAERMWNRIASFYDALQVVTGTATEFVLKAVDLVIPDTSGKGIKLGDETSSAFGWRDITGEIRTRGVGATDPDWTQVGSGALYQYSFAINDQCWIVYHIPHDYVPGSDFHLHVHWCPSGTDTNIVKWQWVYSYATGFNQAAFSSTGTTITAEEAGPGVALQHMVTETVAIDGSAITEPDGHIWINLTRVTNGGSDNSDTIYVWDADLHYRSTGIPTVNKSPSFYGT